MSKITKKKLQADHNKLLNQFAELVRSLKSSKVISEETCPTFYRRTTEIVDDTCEQAEPKLKKLDQSVFPLIERESVELTGSDLCRAMLARGDSRVVCLVSNISDNQAVDYREHTLLIEGFAILSGFWDSRGTDYKHAVPVSPATNEPLTAAEVGL